MEKATNDLGHIININKNKIKQINFNEFFVIFRDTILAITYMHTNTFAHRDIKPDNILKMKSGKYVLMDFGIGINLENESSYNDDGFSY